MSSVLIGHESALELYRKAGDRLAGRYTSEEPLIGLSPHLRSLDPSWRRFLQAPIHLVVDSRAQHAHSPNLITHAWGTRYSVWPTLQCDEEVSVSAPEYLFLQMALQLDVLELAFLGCELCGTYCLDNGLKERGKLLTSQRLLSFLEERPKARGRFLAIRAARLVVDGARSPMEAFLALMFSLPTQRGGYGLSKPLLNPNIDLGEDASRAFGRPSIHPDLLWPKAKIALEYDSNQNHIGVERITNDARRRLALELDGYQVITVTNAQTRSVSELDSIVTLIEHAHGKEPHVPSTSLAARRAWLFERLRGLALCAPGQRPTINAA